MDNYIALIDEEDEHHDEDEHHEDEDDHHEEDEHITMKMNNDNHGHGNLIHANYMQEDAEFDGYEFELGKLLTWVLANYLYLLEEM